MRNLKAVLLLMLVLALGTGGSQATAAEFHSEASNTVLEGSQIGTGVFEFDVGTVECGEATYIGEVAGTTSSNYVVTPTYSGCTAFAFGGASFNTNGCEYEIHNNGAWDIQNCNTASGLIVTAKLFGTDKCTVTVPEQSGIAGITVTNGGSGTTRDTTVHVSTTSLHYIHHAGTGFGACTSGTDTNGKYSETSTTTGRSGLLHKGWWFL